METFALIEEFEILSAVVESTWEKENVGKILIYCWELRLVVGTLFEHIPGIFE